MARPFLTIVTGCYLRPVMLERNITSVLVQTERSWEQIFLYGDAESGIDGFHQRLGERQDEYTGRYIYVLPDDDMLVDSGFIAGLRRIYAEHDPDVVMVKADKLQFGILPTERVWGGKLIFSEVDLINYVVRAEVWKRHSAAFTRRVYPYHHGAYAGDYSFIEAVFEDEPSVYWWDRLVAKSQRISHGKPEGAE